MMISAIIVAAGSSRRMGFDKLSASLAGRTVLSRSVQAFLDCPAIDEVICVCSEKRFQSLTVKVHGKSLKRVDGGAERHLSVANGLEALDPSVQLVAVHDGARPLITSAQIIRCLEASQIHDAASCARKVTETLKRADDNDLTQESISRDNVWIMETPQCFNRKLLENAYQQLLQNNTLVTDEVSALEAIGTHTKFIHNPTPNPKVTFVEDLKLAEHLIDFIDQEAKEK